MRKLKLAVAAVSLASAVAVAGAASAQAYGYGPAPAYVAGGESYAPYDTYNRSRPGFTLVGARAGVTVLGINLDGGAGVRLSAGDGGGYGGGYRHHHHAEADYAPPPPPPQYASEPQYAPPSYAGGYEGGYGGGYVTSYSYPTYPAPCGCGW